MTQLYKVSGDSLVPVPGGHLSNEELIETWLARQPDLLGLDILIIGRQVVTDFGGRIDLLGIDADGDLVIVELKRDRTPREIIAQVLDYASWVSALSTRQVHEIALDHLGRRLELAFRERFEDSLPQTLNENHTMVIVASAFDASSERIVRYLSEKHDVGVDWIKAVPVAEAKRFDGMFANQNIVCKLRDPKTIEFLREQFGVLPD